MKQHSIYKGIYEFEDPSGGLLAAKIPMNGSADLYNGTVVIVRPNQRAIFVYKGKITDVLMPGTHEVKTANMPILTRLANFKFNFRSPLRCEIWFFSGNIFTSKKWGTKAPVMSEFNSIGIIPIRAFGTYNVQVANPLLVYKKLVGSRNFLDISEVEDFVQGQLVEQIPEALKLIDEIRDLNNKQDEISIELEKIVKKTLRPYGLRVKNIQIRSITPPDAVMEALESRVAMNLIGDQRKFLLYKAANSLDEIHDGGSNDSLQMMMGLMLGKGILGIEDTEVESGVRPKRIARKNSKPTHHFCHDCGNEIEKSYKFCNNCGAKQ